MVGVKVLSGIIFIFGSGYSRRLFEEQTGSSSDYYPQ